MKWRLGSIVRGSGNAGHLVRALLGSTGLRIVGMCFGFLVGVQLARGLGPAGYGVYGIAMATVAVLMIPTELGLPQLVMREVSAALAEDGIGQTKKIIGWGRGVVVVSSFTIAAVVVSVLAIGVVKVDPEVRTTLMIGLLWIPVVAIGNIYGAALRGMHRVVSGQLSEFLVRPFFVSSLLFACVYILGRHLTPPLAMGINILGAVAAAGMSIAILQRSNPEDSTKPLPVGLNFGHAIPMAMSEGMRVLGAQVGMLVLAALASKEQAGLYRVAYGVYTVTTMPSALINVACAPTISRLYTQGKTQKLARLNIWVSVFLTAASAFFLILNAAFGGGVIASLFGDEYASAANVLMVFLIGELAASLFGHPTVVLNMMRQQKIVMIWSATALVVNLILTVSMVHVIGYSGAAFGVSAGLVLWRAGCAVFAKTRLGMDTAFSTKLLPGAKAGMAGAQ